MVKFLVLFGLLSVLATSSDYQPRNKAVYSRSLSLNTSDLLLFISRIQLFILIAS
jgi:hypothetical protein